MNPGHLLSWYLEVTRENEMGIRSGMERSSDCLFLRDVQKDLEGRDS